MMLLLLVLNGQLTFGQSDPANTRDQANKIRRLSLVVKDIPPFLKWAQTENLEVVGLYRPAKIVVLAVNQEGLLEKVKKNDQVLFFSQTASLPQVEVPVPGHNLVVNSVQQAQAWYPAWNGEGAVVSIREFPFFFSDVDLKNRLLPSPYAFGDTTGHAATMATLVAGGGNSDPAGLGAAPGAQLISSSFAALLPEETYQSQGITVQNHSYGVDIENEYGVNAFAYDVSALESPKVLQVFSSGNKGLETAPAGVYAQTPGFANLSGNFKMAKNILTVGAVDSLGAVVPFSSRGPAYDGRIKPELVAFGQDGSSGAAALVSGAAAVLQHALIDQTDTLPDAVLIKTLLIQSADDKGRTGPDFEYGFGNLNLHKALELVQNQTYLSGRVGQGETSAHTFMVPPGAQNLKVSLVWTDTPAMPGADKALQNDLDLRVIDPESTVWYPWVLNSAASADSLKQPAVRAADHLNNIEQISVEEPAPGEYQVHITGFSVNTNKQSYALAYSWEPTGQFNWVYPGPNSSALAGKGAVLLWSTNLSDSAARLEWKSVDATTWQPVSDSVALQAGGMRWVMPDIFSAIQLRMTIQNNPFLSDTLLVADQLRMRVAFNCADSTGLYWNAPAPGLSYRVYGLGDQYMEPLFETQDTFVVIPSAIYTQKRFTVAAISPFSSQETLKSSAPDIRQQGVNCYLKRFTAELTDLRSVDLKLEIGSTYGLGEVAIEKWRNGRFEALFVENPVEAIDYQWFDLQPAQGRNLYRAVLSTPNKAVVQSDTVSVYFAGESNWVLFPNPVPLQEDVQLLYGGLETFTVRMFDVWGRLVLDVTPDDWLITLPVEHLPSGVYYLEARSTTGERLWSEQLLKNW